VFTRRKMGFGVPLDHWFRAEIKALAADLLLAEGARCHAFFRRDVIERLWSEHQERRTDHSNRLWTLVMLESWLRQWAGSSGPFAVSSSKFQVPDYAPQLET
jgi:asparagine synthase (glutamine-hydrolysing)